jgi:hypothetical protein
MKTGRKLSNGFDYVPRWLDKARYFPYFLQQRYFVNFYKQTNNRRIKIKGKNDFCRLCSTFHSFKLGGIPSFLYSDYSIYSPMTVLFFFSSIEKKRETVSDFYSTTFESGDKSEIFPISISIEPYMYASEKNYGTFIGTYPPLILFYSLHNYCYHFHLFRVRVKKEGK